MAGSGAEADLRAEWIGRRMERRDVVSPRLAEHFEATFAPYLARNAGAPAGIFWCLCPDALNAPELGRDGHPRTGIFLPALPYPRRMWAGGELAIHGEFSIGDDVTRTTTIENIAFKTGSTGPLGFVTVRHHYSVAGRIVVDERQDIVYREDPKPRDPSTPIVPPSPAPAPDGEVARAWEIATDPVLLFRYSAMTFNGHRIHYDFPYATGVEGYDGLVVHGPLQATAMLNIAADVLGRLPSRFRYRGMSPLICGSPFRVEAVRAPGGELSTRVLSAAGVLTMSGTAEA